MGEKDWLDEERKTKRKKNTKRFKQNYKTKKLKKWIEKQNKKKGRDTKWKVSILIERRKRGNTKETESMCVVSERERQR